MKQKYRDSSIRRVAAACSLAASMIIGIGIAGSGTATASPQAINYQYAEVGSESTSADVELVELADVPREWVAGVPDEARELAFHAKETLDVSSLVWDEEKGVLTIWLDSEQGLQQALESMAHQIGDDLQVRLAHFTLAELDAAMEHLIGVGSVAGAPLGWVAPNPDRSGLTVSTTITPRMS